MSDVTAIVKHEGNGVAEFHRKATDAAGAIREMVLKRAVSINGKRYVPVECYQAVANAMGCTTSARDVKRVEGGYMAIGEVKRLSDGAVLATGEGFVGDDEPTWAKRPEFARRSMVQTRAIGRACRAAFAFVVPLIDAGLSSTPAEEMDGLGIEAGNAPPPPAGVAKLRNQAGPPEPPPHTDAEFVAEAPKASPPKRMRIVDESNQGTRPPPVTFRFAACKGKTSHEVSDKDIAWYMERAQEAVNDPERARFIGSNTAELKALQAEAAWRAAQ